MSSYFKKVRSSWALTFVRERIVLRGQRDDKYQIDLKVNHRMRSLQLETRYSIGKSVGVNKEARYAVKDEGTINYQRSLL